MEYQLQYGKLIVGRFDGRFRRDTYVSDEDGQRYAESCFAVGPKDQSNRHDISREYDGERCGSCWLHHAHTEEYHQRNVETHKRQNG